MYLFIVEIFGASGRILVNMENKTSKRVFFRDDDIDVE